MNMLSHAMSPNTRAAMRDWDASAMNGLPMWALERASDITQATVPQVNPHDTRNMLYALPAGLNVRLTVEIAQALVDAAKGNPSSEGLSPEEDEALGGVWHFMPTPGVALCAADYSSMYKTVRPERVTCPKCIAIMDSIRGSVMPGERP